eukprot:3941542-Rhodomonas_salina.4
MSLSCGRGLLFSPSHTRLRVCASALEARRHLKPNHTSSTSASFCVCCLFIPSSNSFLPSISASSCASLHLYTSHSPSRTACSTLAFVSCEVRTVLANLFPNPSTTTFTRPATVHASRSSCQPPRHPSFSHPPTKSLPSSLPSSTRPHFPSSPPPSSLSPATSTSPSPSLSDTCRPAVYAARVSDSEVLSTCYASLPFRPDSIPSLPLFLAHC